MGSCREAKLEKIIGELEQEITSLKQVARRLLDCKDHYRLLVDSLAEGVILQNADGSILTHNQSAARLLGFSSSSRQPLEFPRPEWQIIREDGSPFPGKDQPAMLTLLTGQPCRDVVMGIRDTTQIHWLSINTRPLFKSPGASPYAVVISFADITNQKQTEEKLRRSEAETRLLLNSAGEGIIGLDANGCCTFCNRSGLRILGYKREEDILHRNIHSLIHHTKPDGSPFPWQECRMRQALLKGEGIHIDSEKLWRADGSGFYAEYRSSPVYDEEDRITGAVVSFSDISQRKKAERALQESQKKYHSLYVSMNEGVCLNELVYDQEGNPVDYRLLDANPAYEELTGLKKSEVLGRTSQIYGAASPPFLDIFSRVALSGQPTSFDTFFEPLGKYLTFSVFSPQKGQFAVVGSDISEKVLILEEKEELIKKLQKAMSKVRILSGLLPICAACKKIRDDNGYWNQIESYISQHTEAEFSHSICPECAKEMYPEYYRNK